MKAVGREKQILVFAYPVKTIQLEILFKKTTTLAIPHFNLCGIRKTSRNSSRQSFQHYHVLLVYDMSVISMCFISIPAVNFVLIFPMARC